MQLSSKKRRQIDFGPQARLHGVSRQLSRNTEKAIGLFFPHPALHSAGLPYYNLGRADRAPTRVAVNKKVAEVVRTQYCESMANAAGVDDCRAQRIVRLKSNPQKKKGDSGSRVAFYSRVRQECLTYQTILRGGVTIGGGAVFGAHRGFHCGSHLVADSCRMTGDE